MWSTTGVSSQVRSDKKVLFSYLMLALVMLFWAGNSIVGRAIRGDIPPLTLAFLRWSGAFLVLLPFAWAALKRDAATLRRAWRPTIALGLCGVAAFNALLYTGLTLTGASNALLLQAAIPPLVLVFDRLAFGTRATRGQLLGTCLSILGVAVVVLRGDLSSILGFEVGRGDLLVLCGVTAWAAYTVGLRRRPVVAGTSFLAATFAVGIATMAPLAWWEWSRGLTIRWSPASTAAIGYVALLPSLVAYLLFNRATEVLGPARAGHAIALMPLFGSVLAAMLLDEPLLGYHWIGMSLIVGGLIVAAHGKVQGRQD